MMRFGLLLTGLFLATSTTIADETALKITLDTSEVPHLQEWGEDAKARIEEWHPRLVNMIPSQQFTPPTEITLRIRKTDRGVAATSGRKITVSSGWIEKHPEDIGLVFHELVHVIQAYPNGQPLWITEGIADYLRWAIYEAKPQAWFPRPKEEKGYRKGYRVSAGFLLWLESGPAPGIVNQLNIAMRRGAYSEEIFFRETDKTLDELWTEYTR